MSHSIGYYVGIHTYFQSLQERYGAQLQHLSRQAKLTFRAALAVFLTDLERLHSIPVGQAISDAIESADMDIWEEDEELVTFIKRAASLSQSDIEGLIVCLSEGLRYVV